MSSRATCPVTKDLCIEGCLPRGCRRESTTRAPAHLPADLESRAIAMLDDDQLFATFIRWRTGSHGESTAPSLKDKLGVAEYVDAIFAKVPA